MVDEAPSVHEALEHKGSEDHHRHSHAERSRHEGGHHLLQIENLSIGFEGYDDEEASFFRARKRMVQVIHDLSLSVHRGEILAIVGASGSGKTLLADAIMGMFPANSIVTGDIWYDGALQNAESLAKLRGKGISLVPQSTTYLDPLMKVGTQVRGFIGDKEARRVHQSKIFSRYDLEGRVDKLYPFELSGGMARRVLLSTALVDEPELIIADEPTPGLDLDLAVKALSDFRDFADEGKGVLLITHDIELALQVADRVAVFLQGTVVEETAVKNFASPDLLKHPFSKELWHALPEHDFLCVDPHDTTQDRNQVQEGGGHA